MIKRNKKGFLFTVGDEPPPPELKASHVKAFLGGGLQRDLSTPDLLKVVKQNWEVFHIITEEGMYCRSKPQQTRGAWGKLLGERSISLSDHKKLPELIVSILHVAQGEDPEEVALSWTGKTADVILQALRSLTMLQLPTALG